VLPVRCGCIMLPIMENSDLEPGVEIRVVHAAHRRAVLTRIVVAADPIDGESTVEQLLSALETGKASPEGLLEAVASPDQRPLAAMFGYALPGGRQAMVFPPIVFQPPVGQPGVGQPGVADDASSEIVARLGQCLESHLRNSACLVAQVVVATRDPRQEIRLQQLGFQYLAQLVYMYRLAAADSVPEAKPGSSNASVSHEKNTPDATVVPGAHSDGELCFVPSSARSSADLHDVVERTYTGSRDCPAIDGLRTTADVLDGYRHTGRFSPDHWFLVECQGQTVGCLLLTEHAEHQWELIYMGVVPTSRGRGWGERIARFAWRHVRSCGGEQLVLAVDADNEPALAMYRRAGFADWAHRHVYFKPLSTAMPSA